MCTNAERGIQTSGHLLAGSNADSTLVQDAKLQLDSQGDIRASGSLLSQKRSTRPAAGWISAAHRSEPAVLR